MADERMNNSFDFLYGHEPKCYNALWSCHNGIKTFISTSHKSTILVNRGTLPLAAHPVPSGLVLNIIPLTLTITEAVHSQILNKHIYFDINKYHYSFVLVATGQYTHRMSAF